LRTLPTFEVFWSDTLALRVICARDVDLI